MASTPFRDDPLPSYLENTKSTAYRWQQDDMTDSTAHPSVGGGDTTRDHEIPSRIDVREIEDDEAARRDRVKQLASLLDDLDASAKSSRTRTTELLNANRSRSTSPNLSPYHQQSSRRPDFPAVSDSEEEEELLSDLDEMINQVPSDEDPDPRTVRSPAAQSTPYYPVAQKGVQELFSGARDEISPVRGLKSAQKTPASNLKTPAKQVDFKDPGSIHGTKNKSYKAPSPIERRPPSPRKFSAEQPFPSPATKPSTKQDALSSLQSQLAAMQEDIHKRDAIIQELYNQFRAPQHNAAAAEKAEETAQLLSDAKRQLDVLREETSALRRSQQEILQGTPDRTGLGGKSRKWQEFLETPVSVSQRRSRRESARHSRILDEEDILPVEPKTRVPAPSSPRPPPKDDDLTRLREELAKAEAQIAQLKLEKAIGKGPNESHEFHAKPLAPNMMPDAKAKIAREEKMYYRLGLYKIDRLCSNETANLLKNVLIQLDIPLDQLIYEITNLAAKLHEHDRLVDFAMGVHERIYRGEKMELGEGENVDLECLREMLVRVGKLASKRK